MHFVMEAELSPGYFCRDSPGFSGSRQQYPGREGPARQELGSSYIRRLLRALDRGVTSVRTKALTSQSVRALQYCLDWRLAVVQDLNLLGFYRLHGIELKRLTSRGGPAVSQATDSCEALD